MIVRTQTYCGRMSAIDSRVSSSPTTQHITKAVLRVYVSIYIYYEMAEKISGNLKFDAQGTARHVQDGTPSGQKLESYKKFAVNLQPGTKGVHQEEHQKGSKIINNTMATPSACGGFGEAKSYSNAMSSHVNIVPNTLLNTLN
jgi:hypothetical protein